MKYQINGRTFRQSNSLDNQFEFCIDDDEQINLTERELITLGAKPIPDEPKELEANPHKNCPHCGKSLLIRNPSGYCDHLHYPEYCDICSGKKDEPKKIEMPEERFRGTQGDMAHLWEWMQRVTDAINSLEKKEE